MTDFKAKMHQIRFWLGLRTKPRSGSLQHSPDPLAGFGAASRQGEGLGWGRGGKEGGEGREGEVEGGKARAPKLLLNQGPSIRDLLRHCSHFSNIDVARTQYKLTSIIVNIVFTM